MEMADSRLVFSLIEPNWPLPYSTVPVLGWGLPGRRAGTPLAVYVQVQCREPKTGQQKVQLYCEDINIANLGYNLSMDRVVSRDFVGLQMILIIDSSV